MQGTCLHPRQCESSIESRHLIALPHTHATNASNSPTLAGRDEGDGRQDVVGAEVRWRQARVKCQAVQELNAVMNALLMEA